MIAGASSLAALSRKDGTPERTLWHFFHESHFSDTVLLTKSVQVMNHLTPTRSTRNGFVILDFTSVFKTGKGFEWADWLWNEETESPDHLGYEQVIALEFDPVKAYRKALGMRRFYHDDQLYETEHSRDDFEKKPVCVSRLLSEVKPLTHAAEVLVDGEFINAFLVNHFQRLRFAWTGRIRKSLLVRYQGRQWHLEPLVKHLLQTQAVFWEKAGYRNQSIQTLAITVTLPSLSNRKAKVAVCQNQAGKLAFIGTSVLNRTAAEIIKLYGYRWEIEVFFKDIKQSLAFGDCRLRWVGANSRGQVLTLVAANILELIRKTRLEPMAQAAPCAWFKKALKRMYNTAKITLGIIIMVLNDLRSGGENSSLP